MRRVEEEHAAGETALRQELAARLTEVQAARGREATE
jgi:hypothetical protein